MERVEVDPIAQLPGEPEVVGVDRGDVDRDPRVLDRAGGEERGHERDRVVLAPETHRPPVCHASQSARRARMYSRSRGPGAVHLTENAAHVSLDLGAEPQDHPAARRRLQVPGGVRDHGGAPGKGDRDRGAEAHAARVLGGQREGQERIVTSLRRPEAVDAELLGLPGQRRHVAEVLDRDVVSSFTSASRWPPRSPAQGTPDCPGPADGPVRVRGCSWPRGDAGSCQTARQRRLPLDAQEPRRPARGAP